MRKVDFIQHVIIRSLPPLDKVAAGVAYAESLWNSISSLGYGAPNQGNPSQPRDITNQNYYKNLSQHQKEWFDKFWKAFNYKHDRNGAAMRFSQLGELTEQEYKTIVDAAKKEAHRTLPHGQSRKMAQGWLAEMRYQDHQLNNSKVSSNNQLQQRFSVLNGELQSVQRLYSYKKTPELAEQISKIEQKLKELNYEV